LKGTFPACDAGHSGAVAEERRRDQFKPTLSPRTGGNAGRCFLWAAITQVEGGVLGTRSRSMRRSLRASKDIRIKHRFTTGVGATAHSADVLRDDRSEAPGVTRDHYQRLCNGTMAQAR